MESIIELVSITNSDYHAEKEHVSASRLKTLKKSPLHFINYKAMAPRAEFTIGNVFECLILEEDKFTEQFYIFDDRKVCQEIGGKNPRVTNKYRDWKAEALKFAEGREIINFEDYELVRNMLDQFDTNREANRLLSAGTVQPSIFFDYNGVKLKTRPDFVNQSGGVIVDIKTTSAEGPEGFQKQMANLNYHLQAVMQIEGAKQAGIDVQHYFYLVAEKNAPYCVNLYRLNEETINFAYAELDELTTLLKECQQSNQWPGYEHRADNNHGILNIGLPGWAIK